MLAKLLCTKRKSASAPRCLRCLGATIDIVNSITRTANRSGQGGIFASMFTKGQHRGHGDHWAWRLTGNYCHYLVFGYLLLQLLHEKNARIDIRTLRLRGVHRPRAIQLIETVEEIK